MGKCIFSETVEGMEIIDKIKRVETSYSNLHQAIEIYTC